MKAQTLYQVRIIDEFSEFLLLENSWYSLAQSSAEICPMLTFGWLCAWWKTFGSSLCMHVITVWKGELLVAALPLAIKQNQYIFYRRKVLTGWVNTWVDRYLWLEHKHYPEAHRNILNYLDENRKNWDELHLQRQPLDSQQAMALKNYFNPGSYRVIHQDDLLSPTMVLPDTYEQIINELSPVFRQSLKRKIKTLEKRDDIQMWIARDAECKQAIQDISLETWQHQMGTSMVATPELESFFDQIIHSAGIENNLVVAIMTVGGEFSAFEFNIKCGEKLYNLKLGYKSKYAALSPGVVLKNFLLTWLFDKDQQEKFTEYDLMGTREDYKLNWTKKVRQHQSVRLMPKKMMNIFWLIKYQYKDWFRNSFPTLFRHAKSVKNYFLK
jgi:hypothetical protein